MGHILLATHGERLEGPLERSSYRLQFAASLNHTTSQGTVLYKGGQQVQDIP